MTRVLGFVLSAVAASALSAQTDTSQVRISGTVIDLANQPVAGVEVRLVATGQSVFTSDSGRFLLRVPRMKDMVLAVRRPGYRGQLIRFTESWDGKVLLEPGPVQLPDIKVAAKYAKPAEYAGTAKYDDYFFRWRKGFGIFLDRDAIERRGALRTAQLLEARPGVHVDLLSMAGPAIVWFSRCNDFPPKIDVYVDGKRLYAAQPSTGGGHTFLNLASGGGGGDAEAVIGHADATRSKNAAVGEMLERIPPSDIEMMEIFRGPGELPGEFNNGNCGAISIWTRYNR